MSATLRSIAEEEELLNLFTYQWEHRTLSEMMSEVRKEIPEFPDESDVFVRAYGDKENGMTRYKEKLRFKDPCVRAFCISQLKKAPAAMARFEANLKNFLATAPAA